MHESVATFDALQLIALTSSAENGISESEVQTLAYVACILALFERHEVSTWGYGFSVTPDGAPFSSALSDATQTVCRLGWCVSDGRQMTITSNGITELKFQTALAPNRIRSRYLEGSAALALTMPLPAIAAALSDEPGLDRALRFGRVVRLFGDIALEKLVEQLTSLNEFLRWEDRDANDDDLLVPAAMWIELMSRSQAGEGGHPHAF